MAGGAGAGGTSDGRDAEVGWRATVVRTGVRAARQRVGAAGSADTQRVARRVRVDPDWRRIEAGGAARLGPRDTIEVSRPGRWRDHDPLVVTEGWRPPARTAALAVWAGTVGAAWWLGATRGVGPLAGLHPSVS